MHSFIAFEFLYTVKQKQAGFLFQTTQPCQLCSGKPVVCVQVVTSTQLPEIASQCPHNAKSLVLELHVLLPVVLHDLTDGCCFASSPLPFLSIEQFVCDEAA